MEKKIAVMIGVATLAIFGVAIAFLTKPSPGVDTSRLVRGDEAVRGSKDAANTIVEFSDFECPSCAASAPVLAQLVEKYPQKVRVIYRHFPIPGHKWSGLAARAAEAARKQGKFWEMSDAIFAKQEEWVTSEKEPRGFFLDLAGSLGLDKDKLAKDLDDKQVQAKIQRDLADGVSLGVTATPTFFVNGEKITKGRSLVEWEQLLKL